MIRIDAHQHFWRYDPARDAWITDAMAAIRRDFLPADLAPALTAHGFDGSIAVQADQSPAETRFLLELARRHPFILGLVGWVDLRAPDLDRVLDGLRAPRLVGVRHIAQAEPDDFLTRPEVVAGIERVGRHGLTYDILVYEHQLPAAIALAAALPDQRFVLDHGAKPRIRDGAMEPWRTHVRALARQPHVWCKVSGLVTEADPAAPLAAQVRPYLEVLLEAFGAERLLFGSDWPVCLVAAPYGEVVAIVDDFAAALSDAERAALQGGNAARAYALPARHSGPPHPAYPPATHP